MYATRYVLCYRGVDVSDIFGVASKRRRAQDTGPRAGGIHTASQRQMRAQVACIGCVRPLLQASLPKESTPSWTRAKWRVSPRVLQYDDRIYESHQGGRTPSRRERRAPKPRAGTSNVDDPTTAARKRHGAFGRYSTSARELSLRCVSATIRKK